MTGNMKILKKIPSSKINSFRENYMAAIIKLPAPPQAGTAQQIPNIAYGAMGKKEKK